MTHAADSGPTMPPSALHRTTEEEDLVVTMENRGPHPDSASMLAIVDKVRARLVAHGLSAFVSRPLGRRFAIRVDRGRECELRRLLIGQLSDLPLREV